ncbi:MAG: flavin reductase family protein [Nanoarchaeota archaeon]|nr:flavin reductase family protein [Nanoarchaeota archaeon]
MNLAWGDEKTKQFVTNVGLITSNGPYGHNIMACEWTHHVSYEPGLIAVCIMPNDATHANIAKTKEFGVSLCASNQNVVSSISGGSSGKNVDKIEALKEFGVKFFKGKKTNLMLVEGAALNVECKLVKKIKLGTHTMFVGEVVEAYPVSGKTPLVYHSQKYWKLGENIPIPSEQEMHRIKSIVENHSK